MHQLQEFGRGIEPELRAILKGKPTLEMQRRVELLLEKLTQLEQDRQRRHIPRAIEVLELANTRQARQVLRLLAAGAPGHEVTRHAEAALRRLEYRPNQRP